jgi:hypothetical protein
MNHGENRPDDINMTNSDLNGTMSHGENRPDDINMTNGDLNGTMNHGENRPDDINMTNSDLNGTMSHGENRQGNGESSGVINTQHVTENSISGSSRGNRGRK